MDNFKNLNCFEHCCRQLQSVNSREYKEAENYQEKNFLYSFIRFLKQAPSLPSK